MARAKRKRGNEWERGREDGHSARCKIIAFEDAIPLVPNCRPCCCRLRARRGCRRIIVRARSRRLACLAILIRAARSFPCILLANLVGPRRTLLDIARHRDDSRSPIVVTLASTGFRDFRSVTISVAFIGGRSVRREEKEIVSTTRQTGSRIPSHVDELLKIHLLEFRVF